MNSHTMGTRHASRGLAWIAIAGFALHLGACGNAPADPLPPATPTVPGKASGIAALRRDARPEMNLTALMQRFPVTASYVFVDSRGLYNLVLSEKALDGLVLEDTADPSGPLRRRLAKSGRAAWLQFDGNGGIQGEMQVRVDGDGISQGGTGIGEVRGLARNGDRLSGHVYYFYSSFGDHYAIDASFDSAITTPAPGKPMDADGGDAGEAYLEAVAAMRAGDLDRLATLVVPERAAELAEQRKDPRFERMLGMMKTMLPEDLAIVSAIDHGRWVELHTQGSKGTDKVAGVVEMQRVGERWLTGSSRMMHGDAASETAAQPKATEPAKPDPLPALANEGVAASGLALAVKDALAITAPAHLGENHVVLVLGSAALDPAGVAATWDENVPVANLFAGGKGDQSLWLEMNRDEHGALELSQARLFDADGTATDARMYVHAVEVGDRLTGTVTDGPDEHIARFDVKVVAVP